MAYEVTCPACQTRLMLKDDTGEKHLLCPRCLNMVPHPAGGTQAPVPAAAASAITALSSRSTRTVPTGEVETRRSIWSTGFMIWSTYFIILTVTVLVGLGVILQAKATGQRELLTPLAFLSDAALSILILFPVGYGIVRGTWPLLGTPSRESARKMVFVIVLLVILGPMAAVVVFITVCAASTAAVK